MLASRNIPCKRCGAKGDTIQTVAGWYCQKCVEEILAEPRTLGKHPAIKKQTKRTGE